MALTKRLAAVGNSTGLTFDQPVLRQVGWNRGDEIEVRVKGDTITLRRMEYADPAKVREAAKRMMVKHRVSLEKLASR